jgi:hypothetical protein
VFDDLSDTELDDAAADVAAAALKAARLAAAKELVAGPATGAGRPPAVADLLMSRNSDDPRWERLEPFEQRWALLVIRIAARVIDPVAAVADARRRGSSWADIASALGVTAPAAHERFASRVRAEGADRGQR